VLPLRLGVRDGLPLPAAPTARDDDAEAIALWLASRAGRDERAGAGAGWPDHTARAYRREAERFLLWLRTERGGTLGQATLADALAYRDFLADPQPRERWCAPRGAPRGSAGWRPFEGPLGPRARRQAVAVLGNLYRFLQDQRCLAGNPWSGIRLPRNSAPRIDTGRSLSRAQWAAVERVLERLPATHDALQTAWLARALYCTGVRLAELVGADCDDLAWVDLEDAGDTPTGAAAPGGWLLRVLGKGMRPRDVPLPAALAEALSALLELRGWHADPQDNPGRPLLVAMAADAASDGTRQGGAPRRLSARSVYRRLKRVFAAAAEMQEAAGRPREAASLRRASTHWLRHTFGSHAVSAGVPLDVVRECMGHASLATTSVYLHSSLERRVRELARMAATSASSP